MYKHYFYWHIKSAVKAFLQSHSLIFILIVDMFHVPFELTHDFHICTKMAQAANSGGLYQYVDGFRRHTVSLKGTFPVNNCI